MMKALATFAFWYVHTTYTQNYGVSFPIMAKSDVNGEHANDVFKFLKHAKPGFLGSEMISTYERTNLQSGTLPRYARPD